MVTDAEAVPVSNLAMPPGETLRDEIDERGISQRELARLTGRSPRTINAILAGRQSITPDMALALEAALGGPSARFWLNLQTDFDLTLARARRSA
jgi:HTH-type transcriptional regulator/antitoxin HigA